MRVDFDGGFGTLYIAYAGRYEFVRPILVANSLSSFEESLKRYLLRVRPLFPVRDGEGDYSEALRLVSSFSLFTVKGDRVLFNLFNFDELGIESWLVVRENNEEGGEPESIFVSSVESDREWCRNELSDLRKRLKDFALSLGSDWFYSEEE